MSYELRFYTDRLLSYSDNGELHEETFQVLVDESWGPFRYLLTGGIVGELGARRGAPLG